MTQDLRARIETALGLPPGASDDAMLAGIARLTVDTRPVGVGWTCAVLGMDPGSSIADVEPVLRLHQRAYRWVQANHERAAAFASRKRGGS